MNYIKHASSECSLSEWIRQVPAKADLIVSEGFEERSVGVLETFSHGGIRLPKVIIGQYAEKFEGNDKYRDRFEQASVIVSQANPQRVLHENDGDWIATALGYAESNDIIIDITALSNRALFGALDLAVASGRSIFIAYTEAGEYYPKVAEWNLLREPIRNSSSTTETIDEQKWLFGLEHKVELVMGHEGYDSAGCGLALVSFLPFKRARLAAILGEEDYADFLFIAGCPRLGKNSWRLQALKDINEDIIKDRRVVDMDTFGYRKTLEDLSNLLFTEDSILEKYDVHLGILGSKLQDISCWAISCMVPALTVVTSVPYNYFPEAFSEGVGEKWIFPLSRPSSASLSSINKKYT